MKSLSKLALLPVLALSSCRESFLDEQPLDFLSADNAFKDFDASLNNMCCLVRLEFYTQDDACSIDYIYGTRDRSAHTLFLLRPASYRQQAPALRGTSQE